MELLYFLLLAYAGMVVHFLKKTLKDGDESFKAILGFFTNHFTSTVITVIVVTVTVVATFFQIPEELTLLSSVGIGYAGDSAMNKWEK